MSVRALTERFVWGFVRPARLLWALRTQPMAFRRAMNTAVVQVIATLALAAGVVAYRAEGLADTRAVKQRAPKLERVELPRPPPPPVAIELEGAESPIEAPGEVEEAKGGEAPPPPVPVRVPPEDEGSAEISAAIDEAAGTEQGTADADAEDAEAKLPWWQRLWALAVSAVFAAQWVVLALARDYQDRTSRDLSLVAGIFPEEADQTPHVRIDWKWLRRKLRRRIRGLQVLIPGFLVASPVLFLTRIFELPLIATVLTFGWTFYWWMVLNEAASRQSWCEME